MYFRIITILNTYGEVDKYMKTKFLPLSFLCYTVIMTALSAVQLLFCIDPATGFFHKGLTAFGVIPVIISLSFFGVVFFTVKTVRPRYKSSCELSFFNVITAAVCALVILVDLITGVFSSGVISAIPMLFFMLILMYYVFIVAFGFTGKEMLPILSFLPIPYWLYKLITIFIDMTDMTIISENLFRLISAALLLINFVILAKVVCHFNFKHNSRILTSVGLATSGIVIGGSLPQYFLALTGKSGLLHFSSGPDVTVFVSAVYLAVFILTLNGKDNYKQ